MMQCVCSFGRARRLALLTVLSSVVPLQRAGAQAAIPDSGQSQAAAQPAAQPVSITLQEAIHRAQISEPGFASALGDSRSAALDRSIARAALLPGVTYHNQYLYTQGTGLSTPSSQGPSTAAPRFIANNAVHEYMSQGVVDETIGLTQVGGLRRADAVAAIAAAEFEISRR